NEKQGAKSSTLVDLTPELRQTIHDTMKPLLEKWCGEALEPTYVYGIRIYHHKAILKSHRDRLETHIISAIINVDQEINEDWPLVIEDNYYREHHLLLKPGEMVFYEGARLKHGRPIALNGKSFANIFCHFKPVGYVPGSL
ncbi:MAG TPA: proline hydroxylase, partial [Crenotrichaceae bacterium]|nr:proline hydroxylase [Crenotrichaceae bacterium]